MVLMMITSAARVTAAVVVGIGEVAYVPLFSFCTKSTAIKSPLVTMRKPTTGLAAVSVGIENRAHEHVIASAVHVVPLFCVIWTVPVPTRPLDERRLAARARGDRGRQQAGGIGRGRRQLQAELATPSMPTWFLVAVQLVLTHEALVCVRFCSTTLVRASSISRPLSVRRAALAANLVHTPARRSAKDAVPARVTVKGAIEVLAAPSDGRGIGGEIERQGGIDHVGDRDGDGLVGRWPVVLVARTITT